MGPNLCCISCFDILGNRFDIFAAISGKTLNACESAFVSGGKLTYQVLPQNENALLASSIEGLTISDSGFVVSVVLRLKPT